MGGPAGGTQTLSLSQKLLPEKCRSPGAEVGLGSRVSGQRAPQGKPNRLPERPRGWRFKATGQDLHQQRGLWGPWGGLAQQKGPHAVAGREGSQPEEEPHPGAWASEPWANRVPQSQSPWNLGTQPDLEAGSLQMALVKTGSLQSRSPESSDRWCHRKKETWAQTQGGAV